MSTPQLTYTGLDVLETLDRATNYNSLLLDLIVDSSGDYSRMLDFGALEPLRSFFETRVWMWSALSLTRFWRTGWFEMGF